MESKPSVKKANTYEPFLRWAGGKIWFLKHLQNFLPQKFNNYHEIFLGGGSVFFNINSTKQSYISDLNSDLINTYTQVRDDVENVIAELKKFKNTETDYYRIRGKKFDIDYQKAAQFIYLNMTSFNGIYRVNRKGEYNVPYGSRITIDFIQEDILRNASAKLKGVTIKARDFEGALNLVKKGDLVFVDPPYTVAHENNGFILYNQKLFSLDDQIRLAEKLTELNKRGALFIVTNAYHKEIRKIYDGVGDFHVLIRKSLIGGKQALRQDIKEYVITNF